MSDAAHPRGRRRWLTIGLVLVGVAAAAFVGYAVGEGSRDDDVEAAETQAQQSDQQAAKAQKALQEEQAQDEEALQALSEGFQELGTAIEQQDAQDTQATQDAVDQAAGEIRAELDQLGAETRADVDKAVTELQKQINDAVGPGGADSTGEGGS